MINLWGHKLNTATEENLKPQMPDPWFINSLASAPNCSVIHYYQTGITALINWHSLESNQSCATAVSYDGHVFKIKPFFDRWAYVRELTQNNRRRIQLQQVSWLTLYHSFLLLTRRPARHGIDFYFHLPQEAFRPEINWGKIWRQYFILLLFYWMLRCSPWLLIHICLEMNTSHYYHTVFACGLRGLLIPVKLLCFSRYETLNSTMLC